MSKTKTQIRDYFIKADKSNQRLDDSHWHVLLPVVHDKQLLDTNWLESKVTHTEVMLRDTRFNFERPSGHFDYVKYYKKPSSSKKVREVMLFKAVKNLYRRINFLQINIELLNDFITEQEFEQEISGNEDKYVVTLSDLKSQFEAQVISDLVHALDLSLDVNEVSELFGVNAESIHEYQSRYNRYFIE